MNNSNLTITQVAELKSDLELRIRHAINEFEAATQLSVHGMELTAQRAIGGSTSTINVNLDVRLP